MLEHFDRPRHAGDIDGSNVKTGSAGSRRQGVVVRFQLDILDGRIVNVGYRVFGSPYAIAACSYAAELMLDRKTDAVPPGREWAKALEFPVDRMGEALIVEDAIRAALAGCISTA